MKITVFTSNQPRHLHLLRELSKIAENVYAIQECRTLYPGETEDFYSATPVMKRYFWNVMQAEKATFRNVAFLPKRVQQLAIRMGDLNKMSMSEIGRALSSDIFVTFGCSYIKGQLCDYLIEREAINIHMGISPYYRGADCNFWAMYDGRPEFVGATIHYLTKGLDSGDVLFYALPRPMKYKPFQLGMAAVKEAHIMLSSYLTGAFECKAEKQDKKNEIRYSRYEDFTDAVAQEYLDRLPTPGQIGKRLVENLIRPTAQ